MKSLFFIACIFMFSNPAFALDRPATEGGLQEVEQKELKKDEEESLREIQRLKAEQELSTEEP